jgi:hypothetical protein
MYICKFTSGYRKVPREKYNKTSTISFPYTWMLKFPSATLEIA